MVWVMVVSVAMAKFLAKHGNIRTPVLLDRGAGQHPGKAIVSVSMLTCAV
jgi:hypothetical protein